MKLPNEIFGMRSSGGEDGIGGGPKLKLWQIAVFLILGITLALAIAWQFTGQPPLETKAGWTTIMR